MKWIDYEALKKMINDQRMTGPETIHGLDHWEQVEHNGLLLAKKTGADPTIIKLFALFHDSRRIDDGYDPEHGPRAALFLDSCRGQYFELEEKKYNLLKQVSQKTLDELVTISLPQCKQGTFSPISTVGKSPSKSPIS